MLDAYIKVTGNVTILERALPLASVCTESLYWQDLDRQSDDLDADNNSKRCNGGIQTGPPSSLPPTPTQPTPFTCTTSPTQRLALKYIISPNLRSLISLTDRATSKITKQHSALLPR